MNSRIRVYELARELGLTSKELISLLDGEGVEVKSHASAIDPEIADLFRDQVILARQQKGDTERPVVPMVLEGPPGEDVAATGDIEGKELYLKPPVTVRDLAEGLGRKPNELVGELMTMNVFAAINQVLEPELIDRVCAKHGYRFARGRRGRTGKAKAREDEPTRGKPEGKLQLRPPVVAFLGHVDHGKTSLLDHIRETRVAEGEAGGITQHIGASVIEKDRQRITFLDTPGHEAFTAMRARGANATDIVVLVVAADDGVMPQTIEAISHSHAAGVPMVVAVNKMDLPGANPDKVLLGLQQNGVNTEDWGGDVGVIQVSAVTGQGIDELLERILLEAEVMELGADPAAPAEGLVIEAQLESGMGPTANVLIRNGTLHVGDVVICGEYYGRVRALVDDRGRRLRSAGPSVPVKVLGISGVPEAGEKLVTRQDEREAKAIAEERAVQSRQGHLAVERHASLEDLFRQIEEDLREELKLILKADVRGSLEAIIDSLAKIQSEKITINVIHGGVGEITDNDVVLAAASDAIVLGFHVRAMPGVNKAARHHGVEIRLYSVIYELLENIRDAMRGRLQPEYRETPLGEAQILQIFQTSNAGKICGCVVNEGAMRVGANAKVWREEELIYNGQIESLRRFKDDVKEVKSGLECGIQLDNFTDFEVGDIIRASTLEQIAAEL